MNFVNNDEYTFTDEATRKIEELHSGDLNYDEESDNLRIWAIIATEDEDGVMNVHDIYIPKSNIHSGDYEVTPRHQEEMLIDLMAQKRFEDIKNLRGFALSVKDESGVQGRIIDEVYEDNITNHNESGYSLEFTIDCDDEDEEDSGW